MAFHGGEKCSKLDLTHAYQHLVLSQESRPPLNVNIHKELFQPERLQFGFYLGSGMFKRQMEKLLDKILFVKVRSADILISGRDDAEHLQILKSILSIIKKWILIKIKKMCVFTARS